MTDNPYKRIKDIKQEHQNNFSKDLQIWKIYFILKDNCFSYIASQLASKLMIKFKAKDLIGTKEKIKIDLTYFYIWVNILSEIDKRKEIY